MSFELRPNTTADGRDVTIGALDGTDHHYKIVGVSKATKRAFSEAQRDVEAVEADESLDAEERDDLMVRLRIRQIALRLRAVNGSPSAGELLESYWVDGVLEEEQIIALWVEVGLKTRELAEKLAPPPFLNSASTTSGSGTSG